MSRAPMALPANKLAPPGWPTVRRNAPSSSSCKWRTGHHRAPNKQLLLATPTKAGPAPAAAPRQPASTNNHNNNYGSLWRTKLVAGIGRVGSSFKEDLSSSINHFGQMINGSGPGGGGGGGGRRRQQSKLNKGLKPRATSQQPSAVATQPTSAAALAQIKPLASGKKDSSLSSLSTTTTTSGLVGCYNKQASLPAVFGPCQDGPVKGNGASWSGRASSVQLSEQLQLLRTAQRHLLAGGGHAKRAGLSRTRSEFRAKKNRLTNNLTNTMTPTRATHVATATATNHAAAAATAAPAANKPLKLQRAMSNSCSRGSSSAPTTNTNRVPSWLRDLIGLSPNWFPFANGAPSKGSPARLILAFLLVATLTCQCSLIAGAEKDADPNSAEAAYWRDELIYDHSELLDTGEVSADLKKEFREIVQQANSRVRQMADRLTGNLLGPTTEERPHSGGAGAGAERNTLATDNDNENDNDNHTDNVNDAAAAAADTGPGTYTDTNTDAGTDTSTDADTNAGTDSDGPGAGAELPPRVVVERRRLDRNRANEPPPDMRTQPMRRDPNSQQQQQQQQLLTLGATSISPGDATAAASQRPPARQTNEPAEQAPPDGSGAASQDWAAAGTEGSFGRRARQAPEGVHDALMQHLVEVIEDFRLMPRLLAGLHAQSVQQQQQQQQQQLQQQEPPMLLLLQPRRFEPPRPAQPAGGVGPLAAEASIDEEGSSDDGGGLGGADGGLNWSLEPSGSLPEAPTDGVASGTELADRQTVAVEAASNFQRQVQQVPSLLGAGGDVYVDADVDADDETVPASEAPPADAPFHIVEDIDQIVEDSQQVDIPAAPESPMGGQRWPRAAYDPYFDENTANGPVVDENDDAKLDLDREEAIVARILAKRARLSMVAAAAGTGTGAAQVPEPIVAGQLSGNEKFQDWVHALSQLLPANLSKPDALAVAIIEAGMFSEPQLSAAAARMRSTLEQKIGLPRASISALLPVDDNRLLIKVHPKGLTQQQKLNLIQNYDFADNMIMVAWPPGSPKNPLPILWAILGALAEKKPRVAPFSDDHRPKATPWPPWRSPPGNKQGGGGRESQQGDLEKARNRASLALLIGYLRALYQSNSLTGAGGSAALLGASSEVEAFARAQAQIEAQAQAQIEAQAQARAAAAAAAEAAAEALVQAQAKAKAKAEDAAADKTKGSGALRVLYEAHAMHLLALLAALAGVCLAAKLVVLRADKVAFVNGLRRRRDQAGSIWSSRSFFTWSDASSSVPMSPPPATAAGAAAAAAGATLSPQPAPPLPPPPPPPGQPPSTGVSAGAVSGAGAGKLQEAAPHLLAHHHATGDAAANEPNDLYKARSFDLLMNRLARLLSARQTGPGAHCDPCAYRAERDLEADQAPACKRRHEPLVEVAEMDYAELATPEDSNGALAEFGGAGARTELDDQTLGAKPGAPAYVRNIIEAALSRARSQLPGAAGQGRRKRRPTTHSTDSTVHLLSGGGADLAPPATDVQAPLVAPVDDPLEAGQVVSQMDISAAHLILAYMEKHLEDKERLRREWMELNGGSAQWASAKVNELVLQRSARAALTKENRPKNRNPAIVPFDRNRVRLLAGPGPSPGPASNGREPHNCGLKSKGSFSAGDYINASYIYDDDPRRATHIIAQGPLESTCGHFWQMIWEQGVSVIVMLTRLNENGTKMCHRYVPTSQHRQQQQQPPPLLLLQGASGQPAGGSPASLDTSTAAHGDDTVARQVAGRQPSCHEAAAAPMPPAPPPTPPSPPTKIAPKTMTPTPAAATPPTTATATAANGRRCSVTSVVASGELSDFAAPTLTFDASSPATGWTLVKQPQQSGPTAGNGNTDKVTSPNNNNNSSNKNLFELHLVSEHVSSSDYLVRNMYIVNRATGQNRTITQFHYLAWPKNGVPENVRSFLHFRRKVHKSYRNFQRPILVHSSDGAGRAGTYVLIDIILERIRQGAKEIDPRATLEHLRDQRVGLCATQSQFEFVLVALADEIQMILNALPQ